jgi:hypothetical protein
LKKWNSVSRQWELYPGIYSFVTGSHSQDERIQLSIKLPN